MFAGISITCFAASYSVALVLEVSRFFFRSSVRGAVMIGFAAAGLTAQTMFLAHRAITATAMPLSSAFDCYLLASWCLAAIYLYLTIYHPRTSFGVFVLPLVLVLVALAHFVASRESFAESQAVRFWGGLHGAFLLLGMVAVFTGFAGGLMFLVQASRLKRKLPPGDGLRLPSLEWLERLNGRATVVSIVALALGLLSGVILNLSTRRLGVGQLPWNDPIIWSAALLLGWVVAAALFSAFYRPARQGRKVAYLTVASFLFLSLFLLLRWLLPSQHNPLPREDEAALPAAAATQPAAAAVLPAVAETQFTAAERQPAVHLLVQSANCATRGDS